MTCKTCRFGEELTTTGRYLCHWDNTGRINYSEFWCTDGEWRKEDSWVTWWDVEDGVEENDV